MFTPSLGQQCNMFSSALDKRQYITNRKWHNGLLSTRVVALPLILNDLQDIVSADCCNYLCGIVAVNCVVPRLLCTKCNHCKLLMLNDQLCFHQSWPSLLVVHCVLYTAVLCIVAVCPLCWDVLTWLFTAVLSGPRETVSNAVRQWKETETVGCYRRR